MDFYSSDGVSCPRDPRIPITKKNPWAVLPIRLCNSDSDSVWSGGEPCHFIMPFCSCCCCRPACLTQSMGLGLSWPASMHTAPFCFGPATDNHMDTLLVCRSVAAIQCQCPNVPMLSLSGGSFYSMDKTSCPSARLQPHQYSVTRGLGRSSVFRLGNPLSRQLCRTHVHVSSVSEIAISSITSAN